MSASGRRSPVSKESRICFNLTPLIRDSPGMIFDALLDPPGLEALFAANSGDCISGKVRNVVIQIHLYSGNTYTQVYKTRACLDKKEHTNGKIG